MAWHAQSYTGNFVIKIIHYRNGLIFHIKMAHCVKECNFLYQNDILREPHYFTVSFIEEMSLEGLWDATLSKGNLKVTYEINGTSVKVASCSWGNCKDIPQSSLSSTDDESNYPSSLRWKMVKEIHESGINLYMRNVNGKLEVVYHKPAANYKNPGTGIKGKPVDINLKQISLLRNKRTRKFLEKQTICLQLLHQWENSSPYILIKQSFFIEGCLYEILM